MSWIRAFYSVQYFYQLLGELKTLAQDIRSELSDGRCKPKSD